MKNIAAALARAQGKIENAKKGNINPHFKSRYADLAAVWDACREPMTSEGLSVIQLPCEAPPGYVGLHTLILHTSGETISERFHMPVSKANDPQAVGSALTYAKRYALLGAAGIAPEDDDGNAAAAKPSPPRASNTDWNKVIADTMADLEKTKDEAGARALYSSVRSSTIDEPYKTTLLAQMSDVIRARLAKAAK